MYLLYSTHCGLYLLVDVQNLVISGQWEPLQNLATGSFYKHFLMEIQNSYGKCNYH